MVDNVKKDAVQWKQAITFPKAYGELEVQECKPELFKGCDIIFSGLDSGVAKQREMEFLMADFAVFSNAKDYRQDVSSLFPNAIPLLELTSATAHRPSRRTHCQSLTLRCYTTSAAALRA
jgi:aspartate-semialdehyde dehydrogenase